jgi:hypothetical protein
MSIQGDTDPHTTPKLGRLVRQPRIHLGVVFMPGGRTSSQQDKEEDGVTRIRNGKAELDTLSLLSSFSGDTGRSVSPPP